MDDIIKLGIYGKLSSKQKHEILSLLNILFDVKFIIDDVAIIKGLDDYRFINLILVMEHKRFIKITICKPMENGNKIMCNEIMFYNVEYTEYKKSIIESAFIFSLEHKQEAIWNFKGRYRELNDNNSLYEYINRMKENSLKTFVSCEVKNRYNKDIEKEKIINELYLVLDEAEFEKKYYDNKHINLDINFFYLMFS